MGQAVDYHEAFVASHSSALNTLFSLTHGLEIPESWLTSYAAVAIKAEP